PSARSSARCWGTAASASSRASASRGPGRRPRSTSCSSARAAAGSPPPERPSGHHRRVRRAALVLILVLATCAPAYAETIGTSVRGRPIELRRIGAPDAPRKVLVVG